MNGKSDVLAVLDAEIAKYARGKGMELREARATAERLADAVDGALDVLGPTVKPVPAEVKRLALMHLRAALEEFRGAA